MVLGGMKNALCKIRAKIVGSIIAWQNKNILTRKHGII